MWIPACAHLRNRESASVISTVRHSTVSKVSHLDDKDKERAALIITSSLSRCTALAG